MAAIKCYMCDRDATSDEHVPPKCIFPEHKDVGGDYRRNLITVPSCDEHNMLKSQDDEFLMVSLAGIFGNNSIGYRHKFTKIDRALRRSAGRLIDKVVIKKKIIKEIKLADNNFFKIIIGTPDISRLHSCFSHIAYGLYYHHFGARFLGEIKVMLGYLFHEDLNNINYVKLVSDKLRQELSGKDRFGENPDIFNYQFSDFDEYGIFCLSMVFYGGVKVFVAFLHVGAEIPKMMPHVFIESGIHTSINFDGKVYEFNKPN